MKSVIFAVIGVTLYAIQNAIIDIRLKQYSTVSLLVRWYFLLLPLALGLYLYQRLAGNKVLSPHGTDLKIAAGVAVMFFIADLFYISAFTVGGNATTITIVAVLLPVVVAVVKFIWVKEAPTGYHYAAFACAALAIVFIVIGGQKRPVPFESTSNPTTLSAR